MIFPSALVALLMPREMCSMRLEFYSKSNMQRLLLVGLFIMNASLHVSATQLKTASETNDVVMGSVEYELPHELGILTMQLPLHWVGGRADGVEALWIDQNGSPFKDNVTLTIRVGGKVANPDELLDRAIVAMIKDIEPSAVSDVEKTQARRSISFERSVGAQEIAQTVLLLYAESADKSYLLTLNHSRPSNAEPINLNQAKIR